MSKQEVKEPYLTYEQMNIITSTQTLWARLGFLIRDLMIAVFRDPDRVESTAEQLYNLLAVDFYNLFSFVYGSETAQQFINYSSRAITDLWSLLEGISTNNQEKVDSSTVDVYKTADQLSTFLASINPYWSADQWKNFFYQYIRTTIDEALALVSNDFNKEHQLFQQLERLSALMGDYMARGIIAQAQRLLNTK